jgi:(p)ppGpp synthase/HD superfamily hydrolase
MNSGRFETEFQSPAAQAADRHRLVVRARVQDMRIAAIWQVLLPFSSNVENVDITTSPDTGFEEVAIALVQTRRESLDSIVARFNSMSWVTSTKLC